MIKINKPDDLEKIARAVTFGKFDGLHLGHQKLIKKISEKEKQGLLPAVFTFDRPLGNLFTPDAQHNNDKSFPESSCRDDMDFKTAKLLLTMDEREQFLAGYGINTLFEYKATKENMALSAKRFVTDIIKNALNTKYIVVGEDFRFGYKRQGDVHLLEQMAHECGYVLEVVEKEHINGEVISSSRIKNGLKNGSIEIVNQMLGYDFFLKGTIVKGNQLGRTWNIPTINIKWTDEKIIPKYGVYYSYVYIDQKRYYGMTNIGIKPSIEGNYKPLAETYLYNCNENLYGKEAKVELIRFRRAEKKFESVSQLVAQLNDDISAGKEVFSI